MSYENPILEESIGGINTKEFAEEFARRSNYSNFFASNFGPAAYDSVWAAALTLNKTIEKMQLKGGNQILFWAEMPHIMT